MDSPLPPRLRRKLWVRPHRWTIVLTAAVISLFLTQGAGSPEAARPDPGIHATYRVRLNESFTIAAPLERVYGFVTDLRQYPRYMNVERVDDLGFGRLRWSFPGGPGWEPYFEDVLVEVAPPRRITWHSVPEAIVPYEGDAQFERLSAGRTRISIQMSYDPPGGAFGDVVARLFGYDPRSQLEDNIRRVRTIIEHPALPPANRLSWGFDGPLAE